LPCAPENASGNPVIYRIILNNSKVFRLWPMICILLTRGAYKMKGSTKDQVGGKVHEVKGKIKEEAGKLKNDPALVERGQDEKIAGKIQKKVGQIEKVFEQ
jgi:uncharacterized protein YjbJ (UPF0337 family)